jgi:hypothetical protein
MAQYTINFSSNASDVIRELNSVIGAVAKVEKAGSRVALDIDTSRLSRGIAITFKDIDKQINNMQRKLSQVFSSKLDEFEESCKKQTKPPMQFNCVKILGPLGLEALINYKPGCGF